MAEGEMGIDRARVWLRWAAGMGLRAAANRRPKWTAAGCKERGRPKSSAQIRKKVVPFSLFL